MAIVKVHDPVASGNGYGSANPTINLPLGYTPAEGNVLIVYINTSIYGKNVSVTNISCANVTFSLIDNYYVHPSDTDVEGHLYLGIVGANAGKTVSVTISDHRTSYSFFEVTVVEYSGIDTSNPIDTIAHVGSGSLLEFTNTDTTDNCEHLLIACVGGYGAPTRMWDNGWSELSTTDVSYAGIDRTVYFGAKIVTSASNLDVTIGYATYVGDVAIGVSLRGKPTLISVTENFSIQETILRNKPVNISDSINASDALTRNKPSIPILDAVALTEALRKDCMLKVADSISMFETLLRNRSINVQDSINLLEYLTKTRMLTVSDLINLQDAVGRSKTFTLADNVTLTDAATVYFVHLIKHVADALSLSEVVYANKVLKVNENVYLVDDAKVDKRLYVTDQITLADLLLSHKLNVIADLIQVSDAQGIIINKLLRVSDSITFVELIVSGKVHFVLIINQLETLQAHIEEALRESSVTDEEFNADISEKEYS